MVYNFPLRESCRAVSRRPVSKRRPHDAAHRPYTRSRYRKDALPAFEHIPLSATATQVISLLEQHGFETWAVGGCVRDGLRGVPFHDVDMATAAPWQRTKAIMESRGFSCHETGISFGTLTVVANGEAFEITTFRHDGTYEDGRHPSSVTKASTIQEDLSRRDLTINAMAFHPQRGLLDLFDGQGDLRQGAIRTVGDPSLRFSEDALRILRTVRFASKLDFRFDPGTEAALHSCKELLGQVAVERLQKELDGVLIGPGASRIIIDFADVVGIAVPELLELQGFDQRNPYHIYDGLTHTAHVVANVSPFPRIRWAALLHDIAKPSCLKVDSRGKGHFPGHPEQGATIARKILARLKYPKAFTHEVSLLVRYHDAPVAPTKGGVCRMLNKLGGRIDLFRDLCDLKEADESAKSDLATDRIPVIHQLPVILEQVLEDGDPFDIRQLAISGHDLMDAGMAPGPAIGETLETLLADVMGGHVANDRDALLRRAKGLQA